MKEDKEIQPYYQNQAKYIVDAMFDKGYFVKEVTRSDMQATEDLIAFIIQSQVESAKRAWTLLRQIEQQKDKENLK